jgi:hypothetical protein
VLGSLGGDPAHGRANFTPAGTVLPGRLGGSVTKAIRRSSEEVSEAKNGERPIGFARHAGNCLPQPALDQIVGECLRIQEHEASLDAGEPNFN